VQNTLPYPARFKAAAVVGKLAQPLAGMLPHELQGMLRLIPKQLPPARRLPEISPARGNRRGRVALLAGCVQQVLDQEINWATLRVLNANGVEVVIPQGQVCCGAVLLHSGDTRGALRLAQQNLKAFQGDLHRGDYDAILTNAAGCGSGLKEYKMLFEGRPEQAEVDGFVRRVKDVSVYLAELGLTGTPAWPEPIKVAYHDACHLLHAQGVSSQPRQLLLAVEKVSLAAIPQGEFCCGSAGTYNLTQPELSHELGRRKIEAILSTGCDLVVTGNIGCLVQLKQELRQAGQNLPVMHTFQFLDQAYARRCQV
jgi:glycolate oxidase iron-sulfur subunit